MGFRVPLAVAFWSKFACTSCTGSVPVLKVSTVTGRAAWYVMRSPS